MRSIRSECTFNTYSITDLKNLAIHTCLSITETSDVNSMLMLVLSRKRNNLVNSLIIPMILYLGIDHFSKFRHDDI